MLHPIASLPARTPKMPFRTHTITSTTYSRLCLQLQLVQDSLRHVLVLPSTTIYLLELNSV
jgi:hypothetical protein